MRTLLLIDVQNDFMPFGALPVTHGDEVVQVANAVAPHFDLVVASQDWHPAGHASFATSHPGHAAGEVIELDRLPQVLWADHCVQGTPGASFHSALDVVEIDHVVRKGQDLRVDSYSAFFDNNRACDTGLAAYLRSAGARKLWVMGLATDYCVQFSVLDALREGFGVTLIEDGCRAVNLSPDDGERAVAAMREAGCHISWSAEVLG